MPPVVQVDRVSKRYGTTLAVDGLSFAIESGEVLGFLGPNGAGKTTTMRLITGFMPPTEGRVLIAGRDISEAPVAAKRDIGYLPEQPPLYPEMEVFAYLEFAARLRHTPRARLAAAVEQAIEQAALGEVRHRITGTLSKGYRQRVGLAQALIHDPELLVLDEPTAGLDPRQIHETRELIRNLAGERTVILSTHILPEVSATCDRVAIIHRGRLLAEDTPARLGAGLAGQVIEIESAGDPDRIAEILGGVPGISRVTTEEDGRFHLETDSETDSENDVGSEAARALLDAGFPLLGLKRRGASLEEVFLHLTTNEPAE